MKKYKILICTAALIFLLTIFSGCSKAGKEVTSLLELSDEVIVNPGMGWILYGIPGNQTRDTIALASTGYMRFSWAELNPEEGVYNWQPVDSALNQWKITGKKFAFGVMSVNTFGKPKEIPQWVFDKGMEYTMGKDESSEELKYFIPVWNDPVYVEECANFAKALAEKYDGNPDIAFIDIRNFGNWGEKHLYPFEATSKYISGDELKDLFRPYIENFKKTQLVICCNGNEKIYDELNEWAVDNKVTYRRDGLMGKLGWGGSNGDELAYAFDKLPVIWEFITTFTNLENSKDRKWNDEDFLENIKNNKPSYIGMGQWGNDAAYMLSKKGDLVRQVANMMGYHLSIKEAKYTDMIKSGSETIISISVENSGVTRMFTECRIKLALLDNNDNLVSEFLTDWDIHTVSGGETLEFTANTVFDTAPKGEYRLALGFFGESDDKPLYKLGNTLKTENNWYILGDIAVR